MALCGMPTRAAGPQGRHARAACKRQRHAAGQRLCPGDLLERGPHSSTQQGEDRQGGIRLRERLLAAGERPRSPLRLLQQVLVLTQAVQRWDLSDSAVINGAQKAALTHLLRDTDRSDILAVRLIVAMPAREETAAWACQKCSQQGTQM